MATTEKSRIRFRRGTRAEVEGDGNQADFTVTLYAGEPYFDTTDGHVWISDGVSKAKIDARALVSVENQGVFLDNQAVLL